MRAKVSALLAALAVAFLTLLVIVLNVSVKISSPARLYTDGSKAYLAVSDPDAYAKVKSYSYYTLTDPATAATWRAYRDAKAKQDPAGVIALASGAAAGLAPGWHAVSVAMGAESFVARYLGA